MFRYIRHFFRRLYALYQWFPIIWNDADWDHVYLLRIMAFKMRRMAHYHRTKGITVDANKTAKELEICALLCDRLIECPYDYSNNPILSYRKAVEWHVIGHDKQALEYMTKLMRKHLLGWWD